MHYTIAKFLCLSLCFFPSLVPADSADQRQPGWPDELRQPLILNPQLTEKIKLDQEHVAVLQRSQDTTVNSAATMSLPVAETASSVTVITRADIEASRVFYLDDLLRLVPGLNVTSSGGPGKLSSVFIRGAASERTVIMMDNIPLNDPSSPARTADISKIALGNVERIEIVRGPQSLAFGAGAMGGVINIITRRGRSSWTAGLSNAAGRYQTYLGRVTAEGPLGPWRLAMGGSLLSTEGFSAAKRSKEAESAALHPLPAMDPDGAKLLNLDLNLTGPVGPDMSLSLRNHYLKGKNELDNGAGDWADDLNATDETTEFIHRLSFKAGVLKFWRQTLSLGLNQIDRHNDNPEDSMHVGAVSRSAYWGQLLVMDWRHQLDLPRKNILVMGAGYQQEKAQGLEHLEYDDWFGGGHVITESRFPTRSAHAADVYLEDQAPAGPFLTRVGLRYDHHDQFGGLLSYRLSETYELPFFHSRLRGSYGTAFNPPTLYQLYVQDAYSQGNPRLKPEESRGWELGYEQDLWEKRVSFSADYFVSHYVNQIDAPLDPLTRRYIYQNLDKTAVQGGEITLTARPHPALLLSATYTKLTANDITHEDSTGAEPLIRRADHQVSLEARWRWGGLTVSGDLKYVGPRWDKIYDSGLNQVVQVALNPYTLINMAVSYRFWKHATGFVRIQNLLDQDYVDVSGYNTSRINPQAGLEINL